MQVRLVAGVSYSSRGRVEIFCTEWSVGYSICINGFGSNEATTICHVDNLDILTIQITYLILGEYMDSQDVFLFCGKLYQAMHVFNRALSAKCQALKSV